MPSGTLRRGALPGAQRVPDPTTSFWLMKVLTTGMGETTSDFFVKRFAPELVVPAALLVLVVALVVQLRVGRYRPTPYWIAALMVSVFGTMAADVLHVGLGIPYAVSTVVFAVALAAIFVLWRRVEGTLSVHEIRTPRRERFYWAVVMATFALGTAAGDLTATTLHLGYLGSGVLFGIAFALPGIWFAVTHRAPVATFWTAYVLTRPLGASFADYFAVSPARGGLDLGSGPVSAVLLGVFVIGLAVLAARHRAVAPVGAALDGAGS
ncbi:MAG TPA: hypothetical protein VIG76_06285 [Amnibacterium sp.]|uniref:COG4705 family protein n=1 Tax=Amnibacterium sp. TaxID=1872496 RepID=UPI002F94CE29